MLKSIEIYSWPVDKFFSAEMANNSRYDKLFGVIDGVFIISWLNKMLSHNYIWRSCKKLLFSVTSYNLRFKGWGVIKSLVFNITKYLLVGYYASKSLVIHNVLF